MNVQSGSIIDIKFRKNVFNMNSEELESKLAASDIPQEWYSLSGGLPNEVHCLGQDGDLWEVYYSERGNKTSLKTFLNEEDACQYFYQWLTSSLR